MSAEQKSEKRGMTVKEFFKSTSFKCIIVLLVIVLVCGILLTICNTLFYVSDEERFARALNKIYGYEVTTEEVDTEELETSYSNGTVNSVYYVTDDGNYLINVTGTGGYSGGTVTCWVVVEMTDGAVSGVGNVVIDSNVNQSYISKIPDEALEYFGDNFDSYEENGSFTSADLKEEGLTGGATGSTTAIVNAVNTALEFARTQLLGEESAISGFNYTQYINTISTTYSVDGSTVTYNIVTTGYQPAGAFTITIIVGEGSVITAYTITGNGSTADTFIDRMDDDILSGELFIGKNADDILAMFNESSDGTFETDDLDESLETGSTYSNFLCVYSALFATQNYDTAIEATAGGEA